MNLGKKDQRFLLSGAVFLLVFLLAKPSEATPTTEARLVETYGKLPLSFEANQGQTDSQVKFLSRGNGYTMFLTSTEAVIVLRKPEEKKSLLSRRLSPKLEGMKKPIPELGTQNSQPGTVLRMKLAGSNPEPKAVGLDELPGKSNYFIGNEPKKWRTNVPTYAKVKYQDVYPGVDLVYYGNQRQLEYDFVVAPGADPSIIKLAFEGADKVETNAEGDLVIRTAAGELRMHRPLVYQEVAGVKKEISAAYILNPNAKSKIENPKSEIGIGTVGFQVAAYDGSKPLIIDPVLVYSTYLGGSSFDRGGGIAVDSSGNAYMTGSAPSTDFPTLNAYQTTHGGGLFDAFVTKLNASGSALLYSTYLGGLSDEVVSGIAVDSSGNAYVIGSTRSTNFPTANPFQTTFGGNFDAFVTKLNASGSALLYSTYLGGSSLDLGVGIAVDSSGNAYVTGATRSTNFPTTAGTLRTTFNAAQSSDAFVTKLSPTGSALVYSTYLGGTGDDVGVGIAVDSSGNAYVTGHTLTSDFPTVNPLQPDPGGFGDAFVAKLSPTGSALVYSTYLGGSDFDDGFGIAVDSAGNAYVTGQTYSADFPTTPKAFQTTFGAGFTDAFVARLNATGSALVYSTYLGGSDIDDGLGIAVDSAENAYVTGGTASTDFPTKDPLQVTLLGDLDAFVTKLNPTGSSLVYSTYLGGSRFDNGVGIAVDSLGNAYVIGATPSTDFPTTSGAYQTTLIGSFDAFVAKIESANTPAGNDVVVQPQDATTGTTPVTLTFSNVTQAGNTNLTITDSSEVPVCHPGFKLGEPPQVYHLTTTATFTGEITVCINYTGISFADESSLKLFHIENSVSVDRTVSLDTVNNIICATVTSLSPFGCCEPVVPPAVTVTIDIKPGSFPNSINPKNKGKIPVAILSKAGFSAPAQVNNTSLTFGRTGNETSLAFCNSKGEHVNKDGLLDLVCHFDTQKTGFQTGDTQGVLKGKTISGTPLTGTDSVRIVP